MSDDIRERVEEALGDPGLTTNERTSLLAYQRGTAPGFQDELKAKLRAHRDAVARRSEQEARRGAPVERFAGELTTTELSELLIAQTAASGLTGEDY